MEVICIEDKAFHALVKKVVENLRAETSAPKENKWITATDAMKLLDVTSKITLLRLRNAGKIKFTQPQKKIILYDRQSIIDYLNKHSRDTF